MYRNSISGFWVIWKYVLHKIEIKYLIFPWFFIVKLLCIVLHKCFMNFNPEFKEKNSLHYFHRFDIFQRKWAKFVSYTHVIYKIEPEKYITKSIEHFSNKSISKARYLKLVLLLWYDAWKIFRIWRKKRSICEVHTLAKKNTYKHKLNKTKRFCFQKTDFFAP